jgi:hypothetical protein
MKPPIVVDIKKKQTNLKQTARQLVVNNDIAIEKYMSTR